MEASAAQSLEAGYTDGRDPERQSEAAGGADGDANAGEVAGAGADSYGVEFFPDRALLAQNLVQHRE